MIRITVFANRNPRLTEEEFDKYWKETHAPLVSDWLQRYGVVKYVQYHTRPQYKDMLDKPTLNYDGMADFWVRRYEDFENAYKDPYYLETVKKDEEYLFDVKTLKVTAGAEFHVIDNGRVL